MAREPLKNYRDKRRAGATPGSSAANSPRRDDDPQPIYVVPKNATSTPHDDLRLEIDGVLKS